ncbi:MAG: hypothetical protein WBA66_06775 [Xanthobacteraceae bacterium]
MRKAPVAATKTDSIQRTPSGKRQLGVIRGIDRAPYVMTCRRLRRSAGGGFRKGMNHSGRTCDKNTTGTMLQSKITVSSLELPAKSGIIRAINTFAVGQRFGEV